MKKALLTSVFIAVLGICSTFGQIISSIPLKEIDTEYLMVSIRGRPNNTVSLYLDFGQVNKPFNSNDNQLQDDEGNIMIFNSIVDGLNFLYKFGWELDEVFVVPIERSGNTYYILRRKRE